MRALELRGAMNATARQPGDEITSHDHAASSRHGQVAALIANIPPAWPIECHEATLRPPLRRVLILRGQLKARPVYLAVSRYAMPACRSST